MLHAYGWATVHPVRKLFFNLSLTSISALVALLVGLAELLGLLGDRLGLSGGLFDFVALLNQSPERLVRRAHCPPTGTPPPPPPHTHTHTPPHPPPQGVGIILLFAFTTLGAVALFKLVVEPATTRDEEPPSSDAYVRNRILELARRGGGGSGNAPSELTRLTVGSNAPPGSTSTATDAYLQRRMMQLARTPISEVTSRVEI